MYENYIVRPKYEDTNTVKIKSIQIMFYSIVTL